MKHGPQIKEGILVVSIMHSFHKNVLSFHCLNSSALKTCQNELAKRDLRIVQGLGLEVLQLTQLDE